MKTDDVCDKYAKNKNISIKTYLEDDVFYIEGNSETLMFLAELIKAQAEEKNDDNFCIGYKRAGRKFFSYKAKYALLIHNRDSKK